MADFNKVKQAADFIRCKSKELAKIAIICGSGLSGLGNLVENPTTLKYADIPSFVTTSVKGHKNQLLLGKIANKNVICMQGRFHPYEGYPAWVPAFPIRVFSLLGVETVIITNAAGGINQSFNVGDFMLIEDHISMPSLSGYNPLVGPNEEKFGTRFPSMLNAYDDELRKKMMDCSQELGFKDFTKTGIYAQVFGPSYETIGELNLLKALGADSVGMSTVQEVIAARHCGIKVVACSLVTNKCTLTYDPNYQISHEEVLETAQMRGSQMEKLVCKFIEGL